VGKRGHACLGRECRGYLGDVRRNGNCPDLSCMLSNANAHSPLDMKFLKSMRSQVAVSAFRQLQINLHRSKLGALLTGTVLGPKATGR